MNSISTQSSIETCALSFSQAVLDAVQRAWNVKANGQTIVTYFLPSHVGRVATS